MLDFSIKPNLLHWEDSSLHCSFNPSYVGFFDKTKYSAFWYIRWFVSILLMLDFSIKLISFKMVLLRFCSFNPSYVGFFDKTHQAPSFPSWEWPCFNPSYVGFFDKTTLITLLMILPPCFNPSYVGFFDKTQRQQRLPPSLQAVSILLMLDFSIKLRLARTRVYP